MKNIKFNTQTILLLVITILLGIIMFFNMYQYGIFSEFGRPWEYKINRITGDFCTRPFTLGVNNGGYIYAKWVCSTFKKP